MYEKQLKWYKSIQEYQGKQVNLPLADIILYLWLISDFGGLDFTKEQFVNMERDDKRTALLLAAQMGDSEIMGSLIAHGADVHSTAIDQKSPLHLAASSGKEDAVNILLENSVSINLKDEDGRTPLHE